MANKQDIAAGRAFVEIYLKDGKFTQGLRAASMKMRAFGAAVSQMGAITAGIGGAIAAPLAAAAKTFADTGDQLNKMAARTGLSTEALSELGFAAEQSGANLEAVERGVRRMQKTIVDAADGTATATDALNRLGISAAELQSLSPEDQFMRLAQGVADIKDPTMRAAAAMDVFGRSGAELIPLLAEGSEGIKQLRDEASRLGVTKSTSQTNIAAAMTDAINRAVVATRSLVFEMGAALAPAVTKAAKFFTGLAVVTQRFVRANPGLVTAIAAVSAALIATGTAAIFAGTAMMGLATIGTYTAGILGALASPAVAIGAAVTAAAGAVLYFTGAGKAMVMALVPAFENLGRTAISAFNGIADALMSGDIELAGKIVMQGLKAIFLEGMAAIVRSVQAAIQAITDTVSQNWIVMAVLNTPEMRLARSIGNRAANNVAGRYEASAELARQQLRSLQLDAAIGNRGNRASSAAGDFLGAAGGLLGGSNGFGTFSAAAAAAAGRGGGGGVLSEFQRQARQLDRLIAVSEETVRELRGLAPQFE